MKKLIFTLVATVVAFAASAQNLSKGDQTLNLTLGLDNNTPIFLTYENVVHEFAADHLLSIGGQVGIASYYLPVAFDASYRYEGFDKFDLYGGLRLGYNLNSNNSGFMHGIHIGSNYYVLPNLGIKLELGGFGYNSLMIGVAYKL